MLSKSRKFLFHKIYFEYDKNQRSIKRFGIDNYNALKLTYTVTPPDN